MPNRDLNPQNGVAGTSYMYQFGTSANTRTAINQKVKILAPAYGNNVALYQVGAVSAFSINQGKSTEAIRGIGFGDKVSELVPGPTDPFSGNMERTLLYMANLWQTTGYAGGIDGPVRSLAHHRWPFDMERQTVFSSLADMDLSVANNGYSGTSGQFDGGTKSVNYPNVTPNIAKNGLSGGHPGANRGHTAIITMIEACWWTSHAESYSKDAGAIMESGDFNATDIHDYASLYGEFLASGNDPTIGQLGSIRFNQPGLKTS